MTVRSVQMCARLMVMDITLDVQINVFKQLEGPVKKKNDKNQQATITGEILWYLRKASHLSL